MPTAWLGLWYQRGMHSLLEIAIDHMQTKGSCIDARPLQQYYLFSDRSNRCTRCLVFIQRHINLLQYRESDCIDADDLLSITSCPNMIALDAVMYTLHRNDSKPQSCPIQPPFLLTNLTKDGSSCDHSMSSSYINQCANNNQFHLHLRPCNLNQPSIDQQLVCVGTWMEGFHTYFVARIHHQRTRTHRGNQYACFRFLTKERLLSSLSLSMATDDSCRDLYSKQMSTVMMLTSIRNQVTNESAPFCIFPTKWKDYEWYSINGTIRMIVNNTDIQLTGLNKRLKCHETISLDKSIYTYRIQTYTNCHVTEECLGLIQRSDNVIELYTSQVSHVKDCSYLSNGHYNLYLTFVSKSIVPADSCPSYITDILFQSNIDFNLKTKAWHISIDCDNKQQLTISQNEKAMKRRSVSELDKCVASWHSEDYSTTYFIAQSTHSNLFYCFSFEMNSRMTLHNDKNGCSFASYDNEEPFSIYSVYIEQFCSQSKNLTSKFIVLLITIMVSMSNIG